MHSTAERRNLCGTAKAFKTLWGNRENIWQNCSSIAYTGWDYALTLYNFHTVWKLPDNFKQHTDTESLLNQMSCCKCNAIHSQNGEVTFDILALTRTTPRHPENAIPLTHYVVCMFQQRTIRWGSMWLSSQAHAIDHTTLYTSYNGYTYTANAR